MIVLEIEENTYYIKNSLDELTIDEYEDLSTFLVMEQDALKILLYLGISYEDAIKIPVPDIVTILESFDLLTKSNKIKKSIIIDGVKHYAYTGLVYKLTVQETIYIMEYVKQNQVKYLAEMLAVIYKDKNLLLSEHYDSIESRISYIRANVTADVAVPILNYFNGVVLSKLIKNFSYED